MERFIHEQAPEIEEFPQQIGQLEQVEQAGRFSSFLDSCKGSFDKLTKMAAMTAILSGAVGDAYAHEDGSSARKERSDKAHIEQFQSKETQERLDDLLRINSICREHGLDFIDATSPSLAVHLPEGDVKKVIVHIGQMHAIEAYENSPRSVRNEIVDSQKKIYDILSQAHLKSDIPQVCLQEGLTTNEDVQEALNNEKTHGDYRAHILDIVLNPSVDIKKVVRAEIEAVELYSVKYKNSGLKDSTLFDMSRAIQKILLEEWVDDQTRNRLIKMRELIDDQVDNDVLIYSVGGALMAGKLEHVILKPAESKEENLKVRKKVFEDLGMPFDENEDFYTVINSLPREQKKVADSLISKYGLSKERERPVMDHAETALRQRNLVFVNFGLEHQFGDVFEEEQLRGDLKGVALIKINVESLEKVEAKK